MENLKISIQNQLALREDLVNATQNEDELLQLVAQFVQELIDNHFEDLLRVLYRLDVSERKVKEIVLEGGPGNAASNIAKLIIEREKQKIETRQKYNSSENDWEF